MESIMTSLTSLTIAKARDDLKSRRISALELAEAYLAEMERARVLNAYIVETAEIAREMAKASDARLAKGEGGPLEGVPVGIKDLFATRGVHTQAASHILDGFKPTYESTVTSNLWRDGAVMLRAVTTPTPAESSLWGEARSRTRRSSFYVVVADRRFSLTA